MFTRQFLALPAAFARVATWFLISSSIVAAAQDEPQAPLPEGHFRIVSAEMATTSSVSIVEIVVEAPGGLQFWLYSEGERGVGSRSSSVVSAEPEEDVGSVRVIARMDRFDQPRQVPQAHRPEGFLPPRPIPPGTYGMFSTQTISHSSQGKGGGSFPVPTDRAFNTLMSSALEAGDYEIGTAVEVFRFLDNRYKIHVSEPGEGPDLPELDIFQPPRPPDPPRFGE